MSTVVRGSAPARCAPAEEEATHAEVEVGRLEPSFLIGILSAALQRFATVEGEHLDGAILETMAALARHSGVDRCYAFQLREPDRTLIDNTHEWVASGISPEQTHLQGLSRDVVATWWPPLEDGQPVYVADVAALPESRREEREILESQGVRSLVVVPLRSPEGLHGFMGFDAVRHRREWSPVSILLLQSVADAITAALVRERAATALRALASQDGLTGLANRRALERTLAQLSRASAPPGDAVGVLFVDVDHFKDVNDALGHRVGDILLQDIARRLEDAIQERDLLSRFGGDEFVVLLRGATDASGLRERAERLLAVFATPFDIADRPTIVGASAGLVQVRPGADPESFIRDADAAMYRAKRGGRSQLVEFDDSIRAELSERYVLGHDLAMAIEREQLAVHYQPQYRVADGRLVGVEALLRWSHPVYGPVSPARFIPLAEETGAIEPIGRWVMDQALSELANWRASRAEAAEVTVSVNVTARQLETPDFFLFVVDRLAAHGLPASALVVEVTESTLMNRQGQAPENLARLRRHGCALSVDDFGTGWSSLAYLRELPLTELKVDRSFVSQMDVEPRDRAIAAAIIQLARLLGLDTVAEGVERPGQVGLLRSLGCDRLQGFCLGRPTPASEVPWDQPCPECLAG